MSIWLLLACLSTKDETVFPPILVPIEDMKIDPPAGTPEDPYPETYVVLSEDTGDYAWVHLRGYIHADISTVWASLRNDLVYVNQRETTRYEITELSSELYDFVYQVENEVENIVTVKFTNEWRHAATEGSIEAPEEILVRWQKIDGTEFISSLEGSVRIIPVDDPAQKNIVEVQVIEHLTATLDQEESARIFVEDLYERWVLVSHGEAIPEYK